jgi:carbamate kinase
VLVVAALGGNALARRGEPLDAERQRLNVKHAAGVLAEIAGRHDRPSTYSAPRARA